jgi:hypothetical protein
MIVIISAMKNLPRLIRHHKSGVWICLVHGPGTLPNTLHIEGRRVWSWAGDRLETSQLATMGPQEGDKLGDWVHNDLPWMKDGNLCDAIHVSMDIIEATRKFPRWTGS